VTIEDVAINTLMGGRAATGPSAWWLGRDRGDAQAAVSGSSGVSGDDEPLQRRCWS